MDMTSLSLTKSVAEIWELGDMAKPSDKAGDMSHTMIRLIVNKSTG